MTQATRRKSGLVPATLRAAPLALGVGGLALGVWLVSDFGVVEVGNAIATAGWSGLGAFAAVQLVLFGLLGAAWRIIAPAPSPTAPEPRLGRLGTFIWGRMVRDAAGQLLPFSAMGGFVLGARAVTLQGVPWPVAAATTFADVTTEFLAELVFAAIGLLILLVRVPNSALILPLGLGLLGAGVAAALFVVMQQGVGGIFRFLGARIAAPWFTQVTGHADRLQEQVDAIYARVPLLLAAFVVHLAAWIATAGTSWMAYRLVGLDIDFTSALAIEALLHAALTAAFMVPGGLGVQELVYASLGSLFGCPPEFSLAVSLLRRARDIALGVPILLLWQLVEARRLRRVAA